jgi:AmmeMemoRadiSam system protein B
VLVPFTDGQRELLLVQDPLGVIPGQPVLGIDSLVLLELFDGRTSLTDITSMMMRESKDLRVANMVRDFVAKLDRLLMLDSPRFEEAYRELRESYRRLEIRPSVFDGRSYPADPAELRGFLDGHFAEAEKLRAARPGATPGAARRQPRAIAAPHLDPRRAGTMMALAFSEIDAAAADAPQRVVVFGTGHSLLGDLFALTRKHYDTPIGRIECDLTFVDAVAGRLGESAYHGELTHRDEHSIEFASLYLRHRFGDRTPPMVPILCGGFHALADEGKTPHDHPEFEALTQAIRDTERTLGGRTVYVAAIDLSHVGPRFGDPPSDETVHQEVEKRDREALEAAQRSDADGWYQAIAAHHDSTRICGHAPLYALLRCAEPAPGELLRYERSDEPDGSFVTIASMSWPPAE